VDPATRATRDAANASAAAVVAFAALWLLATQVKWIRAWSPFADDPWDAVMTYAAMFLPFVAGPTWIRSLAHRDPILPPATARRIRWGAGLAAGLVALAAAVDVQAILTIGFEPGAGRIRLVLGSLVAGTLVLGVIALVVDARAARVAGRVEAAPATEPDVVDDLVALAAEIGGSVGLERPIERVGGRVERFLEASAWSPRRHRIAFGVVLALLAAVAFDAWHALREGAWANATVPLVFGSLIASGVLAIYLGTLGPLRLLRPPGR
jgi:hypothetical protein